MDSAANHLVERARAELQSLDDDRDLASLGERYPTILSIARRLEQACEPAFGGDSDTEDAIAFLSREQERIARGDAPPWRMVAVMASTQGNGSTGQAYAMMLALVECGDEDVDIRDLLRSWFSRYGMPREG